MNLIYLALAQALEVYVIFFESLKGGIKNSPREVSSTNFPFDLPVHLHFNLVGSLVVLFATKGRCNYGVDLWYNQKSSHPKFFIHFFIDNSNANISLYALSCPTFNFAYYHKIFF